MILVDSSVWIDFFRGTVTPQVDALDRLLGEELVAIGDLMMTEVLQGFASERDFNKARRLLGALDLVEIGGRDVMIEAARYFRDLRARGITIRKTIDTLVATRCIVSGYRLLYSDRDFDPFVTHLGLERVV
ncbi:type II toxin-antitoxin system VapC family toxin [Acetobacter sicerae]|uniref:type II toxin-antitoxin system VapC family toxin n=1 Tax=Acetobacter sicerae TaxID=85325 RepID=UPI00156B2646|nr:PIN domain nuclease [Acetobacter sicerae]NHN93586.1 PIN domain-containing protein [Acetobacter sicerae]